MEITANLDAVLALLLGYGKGRGTYVGCERNKRETLTLYCVAAPC
jgi:hypothetical protein